MLNTLNLQLPYLQELENLSKSCKIIPIKLKTHKNYFYSYNLKYIQNDIFTAAQTFNQTFRTVLSQAHKNGPISFQYPGS